MVQPYRYGADIYQRSYNRRAGSWRYTRRTARSSTRLRLQEWIAEVEADCVDRIIDVDREVATLWGKLDVARAIPVVDCLLAATALARDMTLVTRNVRDIADTGVTILNPWEGSS